MIFPWLYLFIAIATAIFLNNSLNIYIPIIIPLFTTIIAIFTTQRPISFVLLILSSLLIGFNISYKKEIKIEEKPTFIECISISVPSNNSFSCKVINSDNTDLIGENIKVYTDSRDIFFLSQVGFIGKVKRYKNQIVANANKDFMKVINDNNYIYFIKSLKEMMIQNYKHNTLNEDSFSLGLGLIFGEREDIPMRDYESFVKSGLAHLLAISGSHVSILMVTLNIALFFLSKKLRSYVIAGLLPIYAIFTGLSIPVVRASFMGILFSISKISQLRFNSLNVLFMIGFIYLLFFPDSLLNVSFQLSFMAALGIILSIEIFKEKNIYINIILTSLMATLFTMPIVMYHFGNLSLNSIISTPIASLPLYPYLLLAFLNTLTGFNIEFLVKIMDGFGSLFLVVVKMFENAAFYYTGFKPSVLLIAIFYISVIFTIFLKTTKRNIVAYILTISVLFVLFSKSKDKGFLIYSFKGKDYPTLFIRDKSRCYLISDFSSYNIVSMFSKESCEERILITKRKEKFNDDYLSWFDQVITYQYEIDTGDFKLKRWIDYRIYKNDREFIIKNQDGVISF